MNMKINNKGVSPLIATVLLVAFSVALGAMVMDFSDTTKVEFTEQADIHLETSFKCSLDIFLKIVEVNNNKQIFCNRTGLNNFEIFIENQGRENADGVQIILFDNSSATYTFNEMTTVEAHGRTKYDLAVNDSGFIFPPTKLLVSPIIKTTSSQSVTCYDERIDLDEEEIGDGC